MIQFCSNRTYSPEYLFQTLQHKLPDHTTEPFKTIVNSVKLFRVFDLNEILDAISQTSELLHSQKQPSAPTLLLVEGLDQCMKDVQRASSTLSALSKLASLLQTLTVLTRKYATRLTVVIVNSTLCPAAISSLFAPNKEQAGEYTETYSFQQRQQQQQQQSLSHVEEQRISTNPPPATQQQKGPYAPGYHGPSISHLLLESFDTHLLVSKREAKMIIEVAKDRVGGSLGRWCAL